MPVVLVGNVFRKGQSWIADGRQQADEEEVEAQRKRESNRYAGSHSAIARRRLIVSSARRCGMMCTVTRCASNVVDYMKCVFALCVHTNNSRTGMCIVYPHRMSDDDDDEDTDALTHTRITFCNHVYTEVNSYLLYLLVELNNNVFAIDVRA